MKELSFLVYFSSFLSSSALILCLFLLPSLYSDLSTLQDEITNAVHQFKEETDSSWVDLMDIQLNFAAPTKPKENPFLRREKRFAKLPDFCQCDSMPQCPPGPPGPPGTPGEPGLAGAKGPDGLHSSDTIYTAAACSPPTGCVKCPAGEAGAKGPDGPPGPQGAPGMPGLPGIPSSKSGEPGPHGPVGDAGAPGKTGIDGKAGEPGKDGTKSIGQRGPDGPNGDIGPPGQPGAKGKDGEPGKIGAAGASGKAGAKGKDGEHGKAGNGGGVGIPGRDAEYCPCPPRSMFYRYKVFVISCLKKNEESSGLIRGQSIEDDTVVIYTVNCYSEAKATSYIEQCKEELTKGINTCIINFPNSPQYFSTRKLPAEAVANPDEYLKQGDLVLTTMFLGLRHSGIYLGNGEVAHVSGHGTSILFARTGRLVPEFVSPGGTLWILECVFRFRDPTRIVEVAREYTENEVPQWKYHIMMRNCQHFTSICAFGFNYSGRIYYR